MEYAFVWKDSAGKEVVKELSSGCWGATGRLDQYGPRIDPEDIKAGLPYDPYVLSKNRSSSAYFSVYKETTHVRIRSNHSGYQHLFRKEMYEIMDYFVHRSPFRVLFHQNWAEQFKLNSLDFNCRDVPALITITSLIWLRDRIRTNAGNTFSMLVQSGVPEYIAFLTAYNQPDLFSGTLNEYGASGAEATPSYSKWNLEFFSTENCTLDTWNEHWFIPQQSCVELGGYVTCMVQFWRYPKEGKTLKRINFNGGYNKFQVKQTINGLFGPFSFTGCVDPVQYTKYIWGLE